MTNPSWTSDKDVYLASADNIVGIEQFLSKNILRQCKNFYSVIGGLGGFNFIPYLHELETITFFDINPYTIDILNLHLELIKISNNINEYISYIFCRPFDININTDNSFLETTLNNDILNKLKKHISIKNFNIFLKYYIPYITTPTIPITNGPCYHCSKILPYHDIDSKTDQMTCAISQYHPNSINSLFIGRGWLKNNDLFIKTKNNLMKCDINTFIGPAELLDIKNYSGLYGSNIWNTDPSEQYSGYKKIIYKLNWLIGYDDYINAKNYLEVQYYNQSVKPDAFFGEGNCNPHDTCCMALDSFIDLNNTKFLEIIEPHPTEGMNYGFRFYKGQQKISVSDYINTNFNFKSVNVIILHILLGAGIELSKWIKILNKANNEAITLIIAEHRKECSDFTIKEWDIHINNLLDENILDNYIYNISYKFKKLACANLKGNSLDPRNLIYYKND